MQDTWHFITVFVSPIIIFIFLMILLRVCWKWCHCTGDVVDYEENSNTAIYVIPISINEVEDCSSDEDSVSVVDPYAPPSYDSLDPPTQYWQKFDIPEEAPPAYSQLDIPSAADHLGSTLSPEPLYIISEEV